MTDRNYIWNLISRRICGEATETMEQELEELFLDDPDLQETSDILTLYFNGRPYKNTWSPESAYRKHLRRMKARQVSFPPGEND